MADEPPRCAFKIHYGAGASARGATIVEEECVLNTETIPDVKDDLRELLEAVSGQSIDGDISVYGMTKKANRNAPLVAPLETFTHIRQLNAFRETWAPHTPHLYVQVCLEEDEDLPNDDDDAGGEGDNDDDDDVDEEDGEGEEEGGPGARGRGAGGRGAAGRRAASRGRGVTGKRAGATLKKPTAKKARKLTAGEAFDKAVKEKMEGEVIVFMPAYHSHGQHATLKAVAGPGVAGTAAQDALLGSFFFPLDVGSKWYCTVHVCSFGGSCLHR